jgi:hypothetical protein
VQAVEDPAHGPAPLLDAVDHVGGVLQEFRQLVPAALAEVAEELLPLRVVTFFHASSQKPTQPRLLWTNSRSVASGTWVDQICRRGI